MAVALATVIVAALLVGCRPNVRGVILMIGDSNLVQAATATTNTIETLDNGYVPVFAATAAATIRYSDCTKSVHCTTFDFWKIRLGQLLKKVQPDGVVIELGLRDSGAPGTDGGPGYTGYDAKLDYMMQLLPAGVPVWWTTLPCDIEPTIEQEGCRAIDRALQAAPARWPNLTIIAWAGTANAHPEYMNPADDHLSPVGLERWADAVLNALSHHFPDPG